MNDSRPQVGNWYLLRMGMRGTGALLGAVLVYAFGHLHIAHTTQIAAAALFGLIAGVAGHFLGHFTANPDREIPAVDLLLRLFAWTALIFGAATVVMRWPAVGLAVIAVLTQASIPALARWAQPAWRRIRLEHQAPTRQPQPAAGAYREAVEARS